MTNLWLCWLKPAFFSVKRYCIVALMFFWVLPGVAVAQARPTSLQKPNGTAIIITGAAAKIAQEAALLQNLYEKGMLKNVVFISGASSGALNAVMLNAILEGKLTWKDYKSILGQLSNEKVFKPDGNRLPVNTTPLRNTISSIVCDRLGYRILSDLPIPTSISVVNFKIAPFSDRTYRLCNLKINPESDPSLNLVDVLMASTSIPVIFPPSPIKNVRTIPNVPYYDGGIAADHVPYQALVEYEKFRGVPVEKVIIVSRKRDTLSVAEELKQLGVERLGLVERFDISPDAITNRSFFNRLAAMQKEAPELASKTSVFVPDFEHAYCMFNFNKLQEQYETTYSWGKHHDPIPLSDYLGKAGVKPVAEVKPQGQLFNFRVISRHLFP